MSCHWWLLVWSHLWRWRQLRSQHTPTVDRVIAWGTQFISLLFPLRLCGCMSALVVNLCFAKVCGISMSFTPHLLTIKGISQSLKDFIGIVFFLKKGSWSCLPSSTTERWGNDGANGDSSCCDLGSMALSELWPLAVSRGHYLQFMAMSTENTNWENWRSDPRHSWGALSGKPSSVNLHYLRVSATVILYVLCMHVHALHCITYHETFTRM